MLTKTQEPSFTCLWGTGYTAERSSGASGSKLPQPAAWGLLVRGVAHCRCSDVPGLSLKVFPPSLHPEASSTKPSLARLPTFLLQSSNQILRYLSLGLDLISTFPLHRPLAPESRNQSRCLVLAALFVLTKGKGSVSSLPSILAHGLEYDQTALNVNERTLHMYRKRLSAINIDNKKS